MQAGATPAHHLGARRTEGSGDRGARIHASNDVQNIAHSGSSRRAGRSRGASDGVVPRAPLSRVAPLHTILRVTFTKWHTLDREFYRSEAEPVFQTCEVRLRPHALRGHRPERGGLQAPVDHRAGPGARPRRPPLTVPMARRSARAPRLAGARRRWRSPRRGARRASPGTPFARAAGVPTLRGRLAARGQDHRAPPAAVGSSRPSGRLKLSAPSGCRSTR